MIVPHSKKITVPAFTLMELVVVCAIIVIVTGVVLANQNKYGGSTLLQSFAYDVALTIRQAQVYGISVQGSGCLSNTFATPYGIHLESITTEGANKQYILFADCDRNGVFDAGSGDIAQNTFKITKNYFISDLCVKHSTPSECGKEAIDIVFRRPELDAKISWKDSGGVGGPSCIGGSRCAEEATITLQSPRGDTKSVVIENNGQISVMSP